NLSSFGIVPRDERELPAPKLRAGLETSLDERGMMLHEEGTFSSLWASVRDVFFPAKLPPLVLESKPIPVPDRMKTHQDPRATAASFAIYGLLILGIGAMLKQHVQFAAPVKQLLVTEVSPPPVMPAAKDRMGGGGGQRGPTPVTKGELPKFADQQITPPKAPPMEQPKIKMPE